MRSNSVREHNVPDIGILWIYAVVQGCLFWTLLCIGLTVIQVTTKKIIESHDGLSWKGAYYLVPTPLQWIRTPFPRPGGSAWPGLVYVSFLRNMGGWIMPCVQDRSYSLHIPLEHHFLSVYTEFQWLFSITKTFCNSLPLFLHLGHQGISSKTVKRVAFSQYWYWSIVRVSNYLLSSVLNPGYIQEA